MAAPGLQAARSMHYAASIVDAFPASVGVAVAFKPTGRLLPGDTVTPDDARTAVSAVRSPEGDAPAPDKLYTLILVRQTAAAGHTLEWLVTNVPGSGPAAKGTAWDASKGHERFKYKPSIPSDTLAHLHVLLILEQTKPVADEHAAVTDAKLVDVKAFIGAIAATPVGFFSYTVKTPDPDY
jgi:hypothetical protein